MVENFLIFVFFAPLIFCLWIGAIYWSISVWRDLFGR